MAPEDNAQTRRAPGCLPIAFIGVVLLTLGFPLYCYFFESPKGASLLFMLWLPGAPMMGLIVAALCIQHGISHPSWRLVVMGIAAPLLVVLSWWLMSGVDRNRTELALASAEAALKDVEPELDELEEVIVKCEVGSWCIGFQAPDGQAYKIFMRENGREMTVSEINHYDSASNLKDGGRIIYQRE